MVDQERAFDCFSGGLQTGVFKMKDKAYKIPPAKPAAAGLTETAGHLYNRANERGTPPCDAANR